MHGSGVTIPDTATMSPPLRSWSTQRNEDKAWLIKDVEYAQVSGKPLLLDLHFPQRVA